MLPMMPPFFALSSKFNLFLETNAISNPEKNPEKSNEISIL